MLKIRLTRVGKRNKPQFRIVVAEHTSPVRGKFIEVLGSMDPYLNTVVLKEDRVKYWLSNGAKPSATVHNLIVDKKIIEAKKIKKGRPKKKSLSEGENKAENPKEDTKE